MAFIHKVTLSFFHEPRGFLMLMLCTVSNSGPKCFPVLWWRDIFTGCSHLNIICIKTSGYKHTVCILVSTADILHHIFNETCIKSFRFSAHFSFSFFSKICLLSNSHACMTMGFTASDSCSVSVHLHHRLFSFSKSLSGHLPTVMTSK